MFLVYLKLKKNKNLISYVIKNILFVLMQLKSKQERKINYFEKIKMQSIFVECGICNHGYVGLTFNSLNDRMTEHGIYIMNCNNKVTIK